MAMGEMLVILLLLVASSLTETQELNCTKDVKCEGQECEINKWLSGILSYETLCIPSGVYSLNSSVILNSISDVFIVGTGGMATILCDAAVGVVVIDVQQFWMENITFDGCALNEVTWNEIAPIIKQLVNFIEYSIPGVVGKSLTVVASYNVTLYNVNVQNSKGVGLLALNMLGYSSLLHCTFDGITDSGCTKSSDDLTCISGTAMVYLGDTNGTALSGDNVILIDNCTFQNSISHSNYVALELSDGIFRLNVSLGNQSVYPLDGSAGLTVIMDRHFTETRQYIDVRNSRLLNNSNFAAGCVFVQVNEYTTFFSLNFSNNTFDSCQGSPYGGAMFIMFGYKLQNSFNMAGTSLYNSTVAIANNMFKNNSAFFGGGIAIVGAPGQLSAKVPRRTITIYDNVFVSNRAISGFALAIWESSSHGYRRTYGLDIYIHGNWFADNNVIDDNRNFSIFNHFNTGTMYIDSSYVILTGNVTFYHNRGAILATRSVIEIKETAYLNITENIALVGGGADLRDGSLFIIKDSATILFRHNFSPLRGGAVNLLNVRGWPLQFRDGCIFYFNEFSYCPNLEEQSCIDLTALYEKDLVKGKVIFDYNDAGITGKHMYGVQLLDCPWFHYSDNNNDFFNQLKLLNHTIVFKPPLGEQTNVVSTPRLLLQLAKYSPNRTMPGQLVRATVNVIDELNDFSPSEVSVELDYFNSQTRFTIDGESETFIIGNSSEVRLRFYGQPNQTVKFSVFAAQSYRLPHEPAYIYLTDCNAGFVFDNDSMSCICDPHLLQASEGVSCSENGTILLERNLWAGLLDNKRTGQTEYVVSLCYLQYCDDDALELLDLTDSAEQCNFNHSGTLCGSCSEHFSDVFGSTRCRKCSNDTIATILLFLFLGILLVALLFFCHLTVSAGLFNGAVLYANAVSTYAFLLYPNNYNPSLNPATVMVSWLNLNLGFELCFYDGMNSIAEIVFRLLFPLYLLFLVVVIIIVMRHARLRHLTHSQPPVPVLSTIIWLSYSSLFQTSMEVLGVVPVTLYPSRDTESRWLQDPTVVYATGGHLVLFICVLLLMLFVLIPLPLLLLFYHQLTSKFKWLIRIHPFVDAFYGPFRLRYYYWIGLRLLFRMGLVVFGHFGQQLTVSDLRQYFTLLLCFYVCALLVFQTVIQPYKSTVVNVLDTFYLTNLTFLFISAMYFAALGVGRNNRNDRGIQIAHTSVSLGLTLIVFGIVLLWHTLVQLRKQNSWFRSKCTDHRRKRTFFISSAFAERLLDYGNKDTVEPRSKRVSQGISKDNNEDSSFIRMRESFMSEDDI